MLSIFIKTFKKYSSRDTIPSQAVFQSYGYLLYHISLLVGLTTLRAHTLRAPSFQAYLHTKQGAARPLRQLLDNCLPVRLRICVLRKPAGNPSLGKNLHTNIKVQSKTNRKSQLRFSCVNIYLTTSFSIVNTSTIKRNWQDMI